MKLRLSHLLCLLTGLTIGISATVVAAGVKGSVIFRDVTPGSYYDESIGAMYEAGIIKGYDDGRFGPDENVTRGQVAVMMQRLRVELGLADPFGSTSSRPRRSSSSSADEESSSSAAVSVAPMSLNPYGTIRFTSPAFSVNEKDGTATISVVRTGGNQGTVTVEYALEPGTANTDDYEAAIATLTFQGKATSATFDVKIKNDSSGEGTETVKITLRNATNGAVVGTPATAELRILDDEAPSASSATTTGGSTSSAGPNVGFSALEYTVSEAGGSFTVTVTRLNGTSGTATVQYATADGSAKSGIEYTGVNGTLSFSSGEASKTFTVSVTDDTTIDGNKNFKINLTNATGVALGTVMTQVVIHDNEAGAFGSGSLRFSKATYDGYESQGKAVITVNRTGGALGKATVQYATSNGTATAGNDYTATSGTLTFELNESSKTFTVPILYDVITDGEDTVNLLLSSPTGAPLGSPATATLVIY